MPGPKRKNTARDREFIEVHGKEMRAIDGLLVWSGRKEDIGSEWQLPPDSQRCVRERQVRDDDGNEILDADRNPLKERCPRWAIINSHICIDHAGGSVSVQAAVKAKILAAADAIAGSLMEIALDKDEKASERIKALSTLLDRAGIRPGMEIAHEIPAYQAMMKRLFNDEPETDDGG